MNADFYLPQKGAKRAKRWGERTREPFSKTRNPGRQI
jgi:hypothetical protein